MYDYVFILQLGGSLRHEWSLSFRRICIRTLPPQALIGGIPTRPAAELVGSNISTGSWCWSPRTGDRFQTEAPRSRTHWGSLAEELAPSERPLAPVFGDRDPHGKRRTRRRGLTVMSTDAHRARSRISPNPFSAHEAFIFGEARRAAGQRDPPRSDSISLVAFRSDDLQCLLWRASSSLGVREAGAENAPAARSWASSRGGSFSEDEVTDIGTLGFTAVPVLSCLLTRSRWLRAFLAPLAN